MVSPELWKMNSLNSEASMLPRRMSQAAKSRVSSLARVSLGGFLPNEDVEVTEFR